VILLNEDSIFTKKFSFFISLVEKSKIDMMNVGVVSILSDK
jgi:hypothetical protein